MIDTIHLDFGTDFLITGYQFVVVRKHLNGSDMASQDYLLWRSQDGDVYGSRAYFRESEYFRFNININPWRDQKIHCVVKLSIPHFLASEEKMGIEIQDFIQAMKKLQEKLNQLGLIVNVKKGRIIRVDLFSDISLSDQKLVEQAINYFQSLDLPGTSKEIYQTSITWKHKKKEWGIIAYNKSLELLKQLDSKNNKEINVKNDGAVLRLELKLLRYTFIQRNLKIFTLEELIIALPKINKYFKRFIGMRLFLETPPKKVLSKDSYLRFLIDHYRKEEGDIRWKTKMFEEYGMHELLCHQGVQKIIQTTFELQDLKTPKVRSAKSRLTKKLNEVTQRYMFFTHAKNNDDFNELYEKIRNCFIEEEITNVNR